MVKDPNMRGAVPDTQRRTCPGLAKTSGDIGAYVHGFGKGKRRGECAGEGGWIR